MKLHDAIVDWCSQSVGDIMNSIDLKRWSLNIIMCLLAMDGLNEVMPQTKGGKFTESIPYFASKYVKTGDTYVFTLELMNCFTYVDGVMMLKLPSGKLIKSYLNQPKPLFTCP